MSLQRITHTGAAPPTGLASPISAATLVFLLTSSTGYPTGAGGPFVLALDPGTPSEEKVLCSSLSAGAVTVVAGGRGWDGTTAAAHSPGSSNVAHVFSAGEADDANAHIYVTTRNDHPQYMSSLVIANGSVTNVNPLAGSVSAGQLSLASNAPRVVAATPSSGIELPSTTGNVLQFDPYAALGMTTGLFRVNWSVFVGGAGTLMIIIYGFVNGTEYGNFGFFVQNSTNGMANASGDVLAEPVWGYPVGMQWAAPQANQGIRVAGASTGLMWAVISIELLRWS
jgi:hypothetical protein